MAYVDEVLADSPLAYYRLGESSGTTMVDSSGNSGRDGGYVGAVTLGAAGLLAGSSDTAAAFASGGGYAQTAAATWMNTADWTIEALINCTDVAGTAERPIAARHSSSGFHWDFMVYDSKVRIRGRSFSTFKDLQSTATITANQTYHVAATRSGDTMRLYIDGVEVGSLTSTQGIVDSPPPFAVGAFSNGYPNNTFRFPGRIDEVAYYGSALSASRIAAHYAAISVVAPPQITLAATAASATASFDLTTPPPPVEVTLSATAQAATAAFTLSASLPPAEVTLAGVASSATAQFTLNQTGTVATSTRYSNDGYNYDGVAEVDYEPPVAEPPAHIRRAKVRHVHQSMPAPTLENGRPV